MALSFFIKSDRIRQAGLAAILATLAVLGLVAIVVSSLTLMTLTEKKMASNAIYSAQAYYAAESGIEDTLYRILKDKNYQNSNSLIVGSSKATINVTEAGNQKIIRVDGEQNNRFRNLQVKLEISTKNISFHYGAQVDQGGLQIQPNAKVIGNVYSNGSIKGAGSNSQITGDAWVAGGVAPDPDQRWTVQNSDFPFGLKVGSTDYLDTAQSFVPSESKVLNKVSLYLKKIGNPPDQTVRILTDNGGSPSDTSLSSGTLKSSKITSNYSWVDISLDPPPNLTAGNTYWIMIDVSRDDNNYWIWGKDSNDGYSLGIGKYTKDWTQTNAVWTSAGGDLNFKTWLGGIIAYIDNTWIGVDTHANTITNSNIGRDAYYQYLENTTVKGTKYPGSPDPATKDLPISYAQIQDWEKAACCDTGTGCQSECVYNGNYTPLNGSSLGPIKINGNLTFPSNGTVTITGPVWATGKILAENNVTIKLKEDLASGYPIIADNPSNQVSFGQIEFNTNVITKDSPGGGKLLFITTNKSSSLSNPACWLYNNVNKDLAQSIIFSLQGLIKVENNAKFVEITGYAIYLANNTEIVYEQGLINASFSSGPGATWAIVSWQEVP